MVVSLALSLLCGTSFADTGDCLPTSDRKTNQRIDIYINWDSFAYLYDENGVLGGLSQDEVIGAVHQAMEQWNHSASGIEFVYAGIDNNKKDVDECLDTPIGIVRGAIWNKNSSTWSPNYGANLNHSACSTADGMESFEITIRQGNSASACANNPNGTKGCRWWVTGDPASIGPIIGSSPNGTIPDRFDLVGLLTHEFGHATGIDDGMNPAALMNAWWERTLYQVDVDCAQLYYDGTNGAGRPSGIRALASSLIDSGFPGIYWAGAYGVSAGGGWGAPTQFVDTRISGAGLYAKKYSTATWRFLGAGDNFLPQAPVRAHRREIAAADRDAVLALSRLAVNPGVRGSEYFPVKVFTSTNGFDSSHTSWGNLKTCTMPGTGFMGSCVASEDVATAYRVGFAYDDYNQASVYAWANLDRDSAVLNGDLRVAWGSYPGAPNVIGPAISLGVRTDVAPGIACKAYAAGNYDCLIAYTDVADPKNSVRFKRLWAGDTSTHTEPAEIETGYQEIQSGGWHRTASPIGVYYHDNKWFVAFKLALASGNGGLRVYSSPSGATNTWTYVGSYSYTANGGTSVGDNLTGNYTVFSN